MTKLLLACCVALVAAAPAAAGSSDTTHTIRASGTVMSDKTMGTTGFFRVNFHLGPGHKVTFVDRAAGISFHSQAITTVNYTSASQVKTSGWAVKIHGWGYVNGMKVPFTAIAVDHPATLGTDIFRISWNHGASLGGKLQSGGIKILQL